MATKRKTTAAKPKRQTSARRAAPSKPAVPAKSDALERVRGIIATFQRNIPLSADSTGVYDVAEERGRNPLQSYGPDARDVPDGRYRVEGYDWMVTVADGEPVLFEKARPDVDYDGVTIVPAKVP